MDYIVGDGLRVKGRVRDEAKIKIPISRRIFVGSFYCNVGHIVSYVTKVAMKNTDKKTR